MSEHRRRRFALSALFLVAVTLLGTAAAPVFSGEGASEGPPSGSGEAPDDSADPGLELELPASHIVLAALVVGLVGLVVQFARNPRETFVGILKMAAVGGVFAAAALLVLENVELSRYVAEAEYNGSVGNVSLTEAPPQADAGDGDGSDGSTPLPSGRAAFVVAAGVLGALTALAWWSGALKSALGSRTEAETADEPEAPLDAVGRVAGEAADRVDAAPTETAADDAIYGTWTELVDLLGAPDPQSDTPRGFERAAIEAGMDPDDVALLTRAFEEVRYGDATLSEERRRGVADAFRRIERSFGDGETSGGANEDAGEGAPEGRE